MTSKIFIISYFLFFFISISIIIQKSEAGIIKPLRAPIAYYSSEYTPNVVATYSSAPAVSSTIYGHALTTAAAATPVTPFKNAQIQATPYTTYTTTMIQNPTTLHTAATAAPIVRYLPAAGAATLYNSIAAIQAPTNHLTYATTATTIPLTGATKVLTYSNADHSVVPHQGHLTTYHTPAYVSSQHNVVRSFDGTISQYSKAVDTAFSSVRKYDTRVNNKVYTPVIATKTLALTTNNNGNGLYSTSSHHQPITIGAVYAAAAASVPPNTSYSTKTISYSPSEAITTPLVHVTFEGLGTHYAW